MSIWPPLTKPSRRTSREAKPPLGCRFDSVWSLENRLQEAVNASAKLDATEGTLFFLNWRKGVKAAPDASGQEKRRRRLL